MLLRNRGFQRACLAWAMLSLAAASVAGALLASPVAAACAGAGAFAAGTPFIVLTCARYWAIRRLSGKLDAILHGERAISLADMSEGELSVLASELDKMVTRLNLTADELGRDRQALADALADISHQIKTPLTTLSISTELLRRSFAKRGAPADDVEQLLLIERLHLRVANLVSALLKLARLDAGTVVLKSEAVDARQLIESAVEPLAIAYDIADVELAREVEDGASFTGDAEWTAEALGNILKNCLEHTPAGGRVTVRASMDAVACRIAVEDTGPGFSEKDLPHIFERFYRGADSPEGEVDPAGVGIGLALAQNLVSAQGGTLTARNAVDERDAVTGAHFELTFFHAVV